MPSVNKVILVGNLGKDPEIRYSPDGAAMCNFSIATSSQWKDKQTGEKMESTEWHRIVIYNRLAEIAGEYLRKGRPVYIEGYLKTRKWKDKETGDDRYVTEVVANQMQMLGGRDDGGDGGQQEQPQRQRRSQRADKPAESGTHGNGYAQESGASNRAPRTAPQQHQPANLADMDDDIPF